MGFDRTPKRNVCMIIMGILFDFIGTTVIEKDPSMLNSCFVQAFKDHGVSVSDELIKANRGKDKKEMITGVLTELNCPSHLSDPILNSLQSHLENNLDNFSENEGASEIIVYMKSKKIAVGLGTGLPRDTFEKIFRHLNWSAVQFDYIGIAGETGKGRPHPDMILDMLKKCNLQDNEFLKVGDTIADIQEGKNARVFTAAILSGTQDEKEIISQQPDFIIRSLAELKEIL
jgi:phosphonatase-like hydrolase